MNTENNNANLLNELVPEQLVQIRNHAKPHVSYSEISVWIDCAHKHKLLYIDGNPGDPPNENTEFGSVMHNILEDYLKTREMPLIDSCLNQLNEHFNKNNITVKKEDWHDMVEPILEEFKIFFNEQFLDWELVGAEYPLYENIEGFQKIFKGFVDCIVKTRKRPRKNSKTKIVDKFEYWLVDFKTTSWGWNFQKKTSEQKIFQLALYKYFISTKLNIPLEDIKCGFILLKRTAKGSKIELVPISVGEKMLEKALKTLETMLGYVDSGFFPKNRNSCKYCKFNKTPLCP